VYGKYQTNKAVFPWGHENHKQMMLYSSGCMENNKQIKLYSSVCMKNNKTNGAVFLCAWKITNK
jgi:hypothetical protein